MKVNLHPADFNKLNSKARSAAIYNGLVDSFIDWRLDRVASLMGVETEALWQEFEGNRGWNPHDTGYLREAVRCAKQMKLCKEANDGS